MLGASGCFIVSMSHVATIGAVPPARASVTLYATLMEVTRDPQREDLDDHRALKAERHPQRNREHHLPPEEMAERPSHHQLVRGEDQRHRRNCQGHHQAAPAGLVP